MKTGKRILAFLLSAFLTIPLLGCSDGSAELIERMTERMQNVQSARMDMSMDMSASAAGETIDLQMATQFAYIEDPLAMKMEMTVSSASESESLTMYLQQTDSLFHAYMRQGQEDWQHVALPQAQLTGQIEQALNAPDTVTALFDATQFRKAGTEQLDGVNTVKITGKLGAEAVTKLLLSSGLSENLADLDAADLEQLRALIAQIGEISITYWIDEPNAELRKAEVDMTQAVNGLLQKLSAQTEGQQGMQLQVLLNLIQIDVCKVTVSYTDIDTLSSIDIPQDALDAPAQSAGDPSAI